MRWMRRFAAAPLLLTTALLAGGQQAQAACAAGPCDSPDPVGYLPGTPDIVVTNFGLLYPQAAGQWEIVCDDNFGLAPARQVRRAADGRLLAAGPNGVYSSSNGCDWTMGGGDLAGKILWDLAVDPRNPARVWVLGEIDRTLFRSDDGGASFRRVFSFPKEISLERVAVAPSDSQRVYVFGRGRDTATPTFVSTDGGATFTSFDLAMRATVAPRIGFDFVAIAPDDPQVWYFIMLHGDGDQLWKTSDGGQTIRPILMMILKDAFGGLAFGEDNRKLYVGGANLFPDRDMPAGRLYVSDDAGETWQPPIPSTPRGPRYRCLTRSGGKLYACGSSETIGDEFMIGVSDDGGRSWTAVTQMAGIVGSRSCVKSRCLPTDLWLCKTYGVCAPGLDAGMPGVPDGGADGPAPAPVDAPACVGTGCVEKQGCSCDFGRPSPMATGGWPLALVAILVLRRSRRRRDNRAGGRADTCPCPAPRTGR